MTDEHKVNQQPKLRIPTPVVLTVGPGILWVLLSAAASAITDSAIQQAFRESPLLTPLFSLLLQWFLPFIIVGAVIWTVYQTGIYEGENRNHDKAGEISLRRIFSEIFG
jgi:hypothetical protein